MGGRFWDFFGCGCGGGTLEGVFLFVFWGVFDCWFGIFLFVWHSFVRLLLTWWGGKKEREEESRVTLGRRGFFFVVCGCFGLFVCLGDTFNLKLPHITGSYTHINDPQELMKTTTLHSTSLSTSLRFSAGIQCVVLNQRDVSRPISTRGTRHLWHCPSMLFHRPSQHHWRRPRICTTILFRTSWHCVTRWTFSPPNSSILVSVWLEKPLVHLAWWQMLSMLALQEHGRHHWSPFACRHCAPTPRLSQSVLKRCQRETYL